LYKSLAKPLFVGKTVYFLPSCHSTNDIAVDYANEGKLSEGAIVITHDQTAGKGQRGNHWESAPGKNLTFSVMLKPQFVSIVRQFDLNIIVSLGILDYLKTLQSGFQVKWPNDIYFEDKKVCGILIQNFLKKQNIDKSIVGIGLNVNQEAFKIATATSLSQINGSTYELQEVLENIASCIEARYLSLRAGAREKLKSAYLDNLYWFGEDHIFKNGKPFTGRIVDISDEGKLQIETSQGIKSFAMKEVAFIE